MKHKKQIVLFGAGKIAEILLYYLRNDSAYEVAACTIDKEFIQSDKWNDLPIIPFEEIQVTHPSTDFDMFVALGYQQMNSIRATKCQEAKDKGYQLISYIHPDAGLPKDCTFGENCFVMQNALVHPRVVLGNNVFIWSGAMVGHHSVIGDHCWVTSCANISGVVKTGPNCFFAVNSTVVHGVKIASRCFIGANTLITKCTDPDEVYLTSSTPAFRLNSDQFLRMSNFDDL